MQVIDYSKLRLTAGQFGGQIVYRYPSNQLNSKKTITIPAAQQAGEVVGGVYPILLGDLAGLQKHGRDLTIKDSSGNVLPHCRIERRHIAALDGVWIFYGAPSVLFDPDSSTEGSIYIGYITTEGYRNIVSHDVAQGEYTLYQFSSEDLQVDDHNQPSFALNGDGKLVVAYTEHPGDMKVKVANVAHDISGGFSATVEPSGGYGSYANLFYLSSTNTLYLWTRIATNSSWSLSTSTDGGATWSAFSQSIRTNISNNYNVFWGNDVDRIWMAGNECKPNGTEPFNRAIYCYQFDGTNFIRPDGTIIGTSIPNRAAITGSSILFEQTGDNIKRSVIDIMAGSDGHPRILYYVYPNANESINHELWHARWTGTEWAHHKVVDEGPAWVPFPSESYPGAAQFNRANINELATCVSTPTGKKEVQTYETSNNGASWIRTDHVTRKSIEHNSRPRYPHGMTPALAAKPKTPYLFWMGNGAYPDFRTYKHCIKAYPADYAYGTLVKVDLPGNADVELNVEWGKGNFNGNETLALYDDIGLQLVNVGSMRFNDSHVATNMVQYANDIVFRSWQFPRLISIHNDGWPSWSRTGGSTRESLIFTPDYHGENEVSSLFIGARTSSGVQQHLVSNNTASPLALVIMRLDTSNRLQFLVYQTSSFAELTSNLGIGTDLELMCGVFQRNANIMVRQGETEWLLATSDQSINASGSTAIAAVSIARPSFASTVFTGNCFIAANGITALSKAYTDTLSRAVKSPNLFTV